MKKGKEEDVNGKKCNDRQVKSPIFSNMYQTWCWKVSKIALFFSVSKWNTLQVIDAEKEKKKGSEKKDEKK